MENSGKVVPFDLEAMRKKLQKRKLLDIYDTEHIDRASRHKAMEARKELVRLQGENMRRWDWMYIDLIKQFHKNLQKGEDAERSLYYFDVLQEAFDAIIRMPSDEAAEIRDLFLGLVKSLHEYEYMMILDRAFWKVLYDDLWLTVMKETAEKMMKLIKEKQPQKRVTGRK